MNVLGDENVGLKEDAARDRRQVRAEREQPASPVRLARVAQVIHEELEGLRLLDADQRVL